MKDKPKTMVDIANLDDKKKLVIELYGLSKYLNTKNDLEFKVFFYFFL